MFRRPRRPLVGALLAAALGGCAGVSPSQMGQTVGTIAGAAIAPGVGAPLGALAGLLAGMLVQGQVDQVTETRERKALSEQLAVDAGCSSGGDCSRSGLSPTDAISPPGEPARVWVDEAVRDGRLVAGHFETRYVP